MAKLSSITTPSLSFDEGAAPSTPAAGDVVLYAKTDGLLYSKDDAGAETLVSGGAGGGGSTFAGARVYHNANQSITGGATTALAFNSERYDTDAYHDTATNNSRLTIPTGKAGKYVISLNVAFASAPNASSWASVRLNGTTYIALAYLSGQIASTLSTQYDLAEGDYIEAVVTLGATVNCTSSANYSPEFSLALL